MKYKTELKVIIALLLYLLASVIYMRFAKNTPLWDSIFYGKDQGFILTLLLLFFQKSWNSYAKIVYLTGCLFSTILLTFNIVIASKTKLEHDLLVTSFLWSNIFCWSIIGLFILLWIFKKH